jgi:hypothetical protein
MNVGKISEVPDSCSLVESSDEVVVNPSRNDFCVSKLIFAGAFDEADTGAKRHIKDDGVVVGADSNELVVS